MTDRDNSNIVDSSGDGSDRPEVGINQFPPSMARMVRIASGISVWTPEEEAWLEENPQWRKYEVELRDALLKNTAEKRGFAGRIKRADDETPPQVS